MKRYVFALRDGMGSISMDEAIEFASDEKAMEHGRKVARELMRNRNAKVRRWHLEIYRSDGERVGGLPFAQIDPTLDHLGPQVRTAIEQGSANLLLMAEQIVAARATARESRALVARSRGKPYLVAVGGKSVWIDSRLEQGRTNGPS